MTLEIKVTDLDLFTKVLNATATVLEDEGTFVITPDGGMTLRNMDKPRFAMVDLKITPQYFQGEFKCDIITLKEDKNLLIFTFEGRVKRQFILPLSEPDETTLPDPSKLE
ncbi:MAG: hypothetical protein ACW98W_06760, partial [Candidatus Hodarchaeales archaeon]